MRCIYLVESCFPIGAAIFGVLERGNFVDCPIFVTLTLPSASRHWRSSFCQECRQLVWVFVPSVASWYDASNVYHHLLYIAMPEQRQAVRRQKKAVRRSCVRIVEHTRRSRHTCSDVGQVQNTPTPMHREWHLRLTPWGDDNILTQSSASTHKPVTPFHSQNGSRNVVQLLFFQPRLRKLTRLKAPPLASRSLLPLLVHLLPWGLSSALVS